MHRALLHFELQALSCFLHRTLTNTLKVQPPTGQTPFRPLAPCLKQSPCAIVGVGQSGAWRHCVILPTPPCLKQSPCALALVVQPGCTHAARVSPPHRASCRVPVFVIWWCSPDAHIQTVDSYHRACCRVLERLRWWCSLDANTQTVFPHRA
jgi:hypothetical protein